MIKVFHNTTLKTAEQIEASGFLYSAAELRRRQVPLAWGPSDEFPPDGNEFVYLYPECHQYFEGRLTFRGQEEKHNIVAYVFDAVDLIKNHNAIVSYDLFGIRGHEQLRDLSTEQLLEGGRFKGSNAESRLRQGMVKKEFRRIEILVPKSLAIEKAIDRVDAETDIEEHRQRMPKVRENRKKRKRRKK